MSDPIVSFDSVTKEFARIEALKSATFDVRRGEILGFIGPNGSGKTTTVRLLLGIYRPTKGAVQVCGRNPVSDWSVLGRRVGVALDQPGMADLLTAREYLEYFGGLFRMTRSSVQQRSAELLAFFGLAERASSLLITFSKGMRQRLSVARCMLNRPELMILDEPFDGLDVDSRRIILDALPRLASEGTSVFVTSHNLSDVEEISDRVAVVNRGQVLAVGSMEFLRKRVEKKRVLIVTLGNRYPKDDIARWAPDGEYNERNNTLAFQLDGGGGSQNELLLRLLQAGVSVQSANADAATLEEVYFALTRQGEGCAK